MEISLIGVISAAVVCGVLFCITLAIVCYLCYRCRRHEEEKSSQHDPLVNGHIPNGAIPTVTQLVPHPAHAPSRHLYQFPTMPARHMANYRPRYIEERNPQGMPNAQGHNVIVKSQTYNGPYPSPKGAVYYDVRQHGGYRSHMSPVWAHKNQEESVATMTLGEESPKLSEREFVLEQNNNRTSVISETEHTAVEKRSSRIEDLRIPSPDTSRRSYLFTVDTELDPASQTSSQTTNDKTQHIIQGEPPNDVRREVKRVSTRRQRRGEDGALTSGEVPPKSRSRTRHHWEDPTPLDFDRAVYISGATPIPEDHLIQPHQLIHHPHKQYQHHHPHQQPQQQPQEQPPEQPPEQPQAQPQEPTQEPTQGQLQQQTEQQPIERYFINDDMYTISTKATLDTPVLDAPSSNQSGLRVIGRPVDNMNQAVDQQMQGNYVQGDTVPPLTAELGNLGSSEREEPHHIDYRVIKSKRRPSWLQNAGQWLFRGKKNK